MAEFINHKHEDLSLVLQWAWWYVSVTIGEKQVHVGPEGLLTSQNFRFQVQGEILSQKKQGAVATGCHGVRHRSWKPDSLR